MTEIEAIEAATRSALVADQLEIDGWWLRSNPSLPNRRPNSATTPPHGPISLDIVDEVIAWFVARDAPPIIRVLDTSDPRLTAHLDDAGWSTEAPTLVMQKPELAVGPVDEALLVSGLSEVPEDFVGVRERAGMSATAAALVHGAGAGYAFAPPGGRPSATGRALLAGGWVGLYDVVTLPDRRRQGLGSVVVRALLAWAAGQGARSAFLQVEESNRPAVAMYERLGFTTLYTYAYRRPPR